MLSIRKIGVIGRTYRHLNRYRQILGVLFKYGFENLIETLKIDQYIEVGLKMISRKRPPRMERLSRAERVRMAFEELGPTYIKLGQVLSTRPDLVPIDFIHELSRLQDEVPAFPYEEVRRILITELGDEPEAFFASFNETPLASASIGQVHRARSTDGEQVAVKVQRPGIKKIIEVDLEIMLHLATLMERHIEEIALHRPVRIVEEFARTLEKEIDYTIEASNMERFARLFLGDPAIYVPQVFRETSTARVITTEFVEGIKISEIARLTTAGLDVRKVTRRGATICLKQIFDYGFFHADPHPGNIAVLPHNVICLFDFGMVGSVDRRTREDFVDLVDSVVRGDNNRVTRQLLKITDYERDPDPRRFEKDVDDFIGRHLNKPLGDIDIGRLLHHLIELAADHQLRIPPDLFLMLKALSTVEGVAAMLDPNFDMIQHAAPFIERVKLARYAPRRLSADAMQMAGEMLQFLQYFPQNLLEITRLIRQQKLSLKFEDRGLATTLSAYDQISNRISFSIIIAALIIGSALIVIAEIPPLFYGISLLGIIGFLWAALMGVWLLVAIVRKGRL